MAEKKNQNTDNTRKILNIIFACVAIGAAVATFLLSPLGKKITPKEETTAPEITWEAMQNPITTKENTETVETSENSTEMPSDIPSVSIPLPTTPVKDPYKNYTLFIDPMTFTSTSHRGVTTITAKENQNVTLIVTPFKEKSYTELCTDTEKTFSPITDKKLNVKCLYSGYRLQSGDKDTDIITTVYCVDNGKGGSIEIKYQYPVSAKDYEKDFDILLSMFKVL